MCWTSQHISRRKTPVFLLTDDTGAKLADIGRGLGHCNLKITSDDMEEQLGDVNAYARDLEDEFGI